MHFVANTLNHCHSTESLPRLKALTYIYGKAFPRVFPFVGNVSYLMVALKLGQK